MKKPGCHYSVSVRGLIKGGSYRNDIYTPLITRDFWTDIDQIHGFETTKITKHTVVVKWTRPQAAITHYFLYVKLNGDDTDERNSNQAHKAHKPPIMIILVQN